MELVRPPQQHKLPVVLSPDEVWQILALIRLPHYQTCLSLIYACGLRLREGVNLRVPQIDSARMQLHVQGGKGNKDRYVPLPPRALTLLRRHWLTHRNPVWLFPAANDRPHLAQTASAHSTSAAFSRPFSSPSGKLACTNPLPFIPCVIPGRPICSSQGSTCA
jgi:integrase